MGLNYYLTMRLIILPQALKIVIPPSVSILISAFKDTSLVVIIALFDILRTTQTVLSNPEWMGFSREAYVFLRPSFTSWVVFPCPTTAESWRRNSLPDGDRERTSTPCHSII